jgi:uncharacterized protein YkwD
MRKPGLLVGVATGVVLAAGIVAATTAGADTADPVMAGAPADGFPWNSAVDFPAGAPAMGVPDNGDAPGVPTPDDRPAVAATSSPSASRAATSSATPTAGTGKPQRDTAAQSPARPVAQSPGRPVADDGQAMQREGLRLVNDARRTHGCPPLAISSRLVEAARGHAVDMASHGYFAHRSPSGEDAGDRVSDTGYDWATYGENIARGQDSVAEVVDSWLHSPTHRENIMTCAHSEVGIGLAFDADHKPYWVQDLASPH